MKTILWLCFIAVLTSCRGKATSSDENVVGQYPVILEISDALLHPQKEILLSELADSISYIPLETKNDFLLGNYPFYSFTSRYIMYLNYCFDWSGKFLFRVGKLGQGPGEDPAEIISILSFCDGNFYTKGQKIIEYDSLGTYTGKELSLYSIDLVKGASNRSLANIIECNPLRNKLFLYSYPDTIFVMNKELEIVSKRFVMPWNNKASPQFSNTKGPYDRNMTYYKDNLLFYNYFRDTVFQVRDMEFHPRWIVKLGDLKLSEDVLYQFNELYGKAFNYYQNGKLDMNPLVKMMDHKYTVMSVNESENYVFIFAAEMIAFRSLRKIPKSPPILVYYNKKTKEIKSTYQIKDDLTGYPEFFPKSGLVGEKMIDVFWPYAQEEWLREKAETDPRFSQFAKRDFSEDNPIVMVAHLKK